MSMYIPKYVFLTWFHYFVSLYKQTHTLLRNLHGSKNPEENNMTFLYHVEITYNIFYIPAIVYG